MEKPMSRNVLKQLGLIRVAFVAAVGLPLFIATSAQAQDPLRPHQLAPTRLRLQQEPKRKPSA